MGAPENQGAFWDLSRYLIPRLALGEPFLKDPFFSRLRKKGKKKPK
jgi:hypothetical protein